MSLCNKKQVPEFTDKQKAECRACAYIGEEKAWCHLFKVWTTDKPKHETKQLSQPYLNTSHAGFTTQEDRFRHHYQIAIDGAKGSDKEVIDENIFVERRQACAICPPEEKNGCPCAGCRQWNKLIFVEVKCPKEKW